MAASWWRMKDMEIFPLLTILNNNNLIKREEIEV